MIKHKNAETNGCKMLAHIDRKKILALGMLVMLSLVATGSLAIMAAWHLGIKSIALYSYPKPIIAYNTALCFLLSSCAIGARFFKKTTASVALCCLSGVLCFFTFLEYVFSIDFQIDNMFLSNVHFIPKSIFYPGRISLNSVLCFLLINSTTLLITYLIDYRRVVLLMVSFICVCMGISIITVVGYSFDLDAAYIWQKGLPGMSLVSAVWFIIMSICLFFIIKQSYPDLNLLPIGTIYIGLALSFLMAHSVHLQQSHIFDERLDQVAKDVRGSIHNSFSNNMEAFRRMVNRWRFGEGSADKKFLIDSVNYVNDVPGTSCIQKLSLTFSPEFTSPNCNNPLNNHNSAVEVVETEAKKHFLVKSSPFISKIIESASGDKYFLIYYPLIHRGTSDGYLSILINVESFIAESIIGTTTTNYFISLSEEGVSKIILNKNLKDSINPNISGKSVVNRDTANWNIEIWPLWDEYNHFISTLPRQVLGIGIALSLLMAYALYLRSLSITRSRELETLNTHLRESEAHLSDYSHQLKEKVNKLTHIQKTLEEKTFSLKKLSDSFRHLAEENEHALAVAESEHKKALKANAAKNRFLTHINHEIRTPLNSIIGFAEMIREEACGPIAPYEYKRYINFIHEGGKHLSSIIEDFLDFSVIDSGKMEAHPYVVDPKSIIESCSKLVQALAEKKKIKIHYYVDRECKGLYADFRHMKQIFLNLLTNSIKFTPEEGTVYALFQLSPQKEIHLTIQDTGMGIDPQYIDKIFDPFGAAQKTADGSLQSSGLGMYLIKSLVEINKGQISIKSKPGVGTNITVILPPIPETVSTVISTLSTENDPKKGIKLPPLKILAAEDNTTNQMFLQALLENNGHTVSFAKNGVEAVDCLKSDYFDVVLMDLQMPIMDGDEATRQIRGLPSVMSKTPVIALTASTAAADKERILSSGMNGYLTKPVRQETLLAEIKRCLSL